MKQTTKSKAAQKAAMVECLWRIAKELGTTSVSRIEFLRRSRVSDRKLHRLFGRYNELVKAAGLVPRTFPGAGVPTYSKQETAVEIARVLRLPNSKLTMKFFERWSRMSVGVCDRRFGSWFNALHAAAETLDPQQDGGLLPGTGPGR